MFMNVTTIEGVAFGFAWDKSDIAPRTVDNGAETLSEMEEEMNGKNKCMPSIPSITEMLWCWVKEKLKRKCCDWIVKASWKDF